MTKLCFSKWSEIKQTRAATLRFSCAPRMPWLLHKSEHAVPSTEFPVRRANVMDDGSWTLWTVGEETAGDAAAAGGRSHLEPFAGDIDKILLDVLRSHLCGGGGNKDDQGDVLHSPASSGDDESTDAVRIGPLGDVAQIGPLGDAAQIGPLGGAAA